MLGSDPEESGCLRPWAAVFLQEDRRMVFTGKETAERPDQHVVIAAQAVAWELPREKAPDPRSTAPRAFVYLMGVSDFIDLIKNGRQYALPAELEQIVEVTASMCGGRDQYAELRFHGYEEALQSDPTTAKWIQLAQIAAMGPHSYILEDGPELPRESGPYADLGGNFLKGHRLKSHECADNQEGQEAGIQVRRHHQILPGLFRRIHVWC
jgi:hypothetical protein